MKSPLSRYGGGRNRSATTTPEHNSYYSSSTSYSHDQSHASGVKKWNPFADSVRSVAGMFSSCFTSPEQDSSKSFGQSDVFKSPTARSVNERKQTPSRGTIYSSPQRSVHRTEPGSVKFTMKEIYKATKNFSPSLKIGQGGFGTVYKGALDDGTVVAIKRAKKSVYDKNMGVEFRSEIQTLACVEHLNLVRYYGFLEHGDERVVILEYVPNGTLREHLDCKHGTVLDLAVRLDIAINVAHAITYLHMYTDHPIIHRDIKSSNILLTETFHAKVADFGFARLAADPNSDKTHVSTDIKGTAGYLDLEYLKTNQLTEKSDVYSFGVLLVELVTSRRPIEPKRELKERITAKWAIKKFAEGEAITVLDPRLERNSANILALEKLLELASRCLATHRKSRPSMKWCAEALWSIRKDHKEISASEFRSASRSNSA